MAGGLHGARAGPPGGETVPGFVGGDRAGGESERVRERDRVEEESEQREMKWRDRREGESRWDG